MNKKIFILLLVCILVTICGLLLWGTNSPTADDHWWLYNVKDEDDLAFAFATALRLNHPEAYEMIDPALEPRLNEWMNTHQAQKCTRTANTTLIGSGSKEGYMIVFSCSTAGGHYAVKFDNILIEYMQVIDWGEVNEEYY